MNRSRVNQHAARLALLVAVIAIAIAAWTHIDQPVLTRFGDKLNHLLAFYVLALLADFSFPNLRYDLRKAVPLLGYGLLIEIVQYFLPYRTFSLFDLSADAIGLWLYGLSLPVLRRVPLLRWRWDARG